MPLSNGKILNNRYRIETLLGQGGFGAVYKAWDLNLERWRALKENLDASPAAQRQFKREAQILCDLAHPNLPRVIDHFVIPDLSGRSGSAYLVMDFVEGEDLEHMLERNGGPLPEAQVVAWLAQVCDALEYLHSQQPPVIHRDIKPGNIKVTSADKAVLVDFGIAKLFDPNLRTSVGARAYTSGYSPPEQYGRGATDMQSDVYALGATAYHLLTGRLPPDSVDILSGSMAPMRSAHEINATVSPQVSAAIEGAMQINRANRWRSVVEFRAALRPSSRASAPAVAQPAYAHTLPVKSTVLTPTSKERTWLGVIVLSGLGLAGVGLLGLVIWGLSLLFSGGRHTPTPESSQLALSTASRKTELVAVKTTATREALLTAMAETQQALQNLLANTQTALAGNSATQTVIHMLPNLTVTHLPPTDTPIPEEVTLNAHFTDAKGVPTALIPAGEFHMGSNNGEANEKPVHIVYLDAYYIDVDEVTNFRYAQCVETVSCQPPIKKGSYSWESYYENRQFKDYPVISVTWDMAHAYCRWRSGDLPTEAQWEKAARGGLEGMQYPWGNEDPTCQADALNGAQFRQCPQDTVRVGLFSSNGFGLFDMAGNVSEWVIDWYAENYYDNSPHQNPRGSQDGQTRVIRGGSFLDDLLYQRVASRQSNDPRLWWYDVGFRCSRSP